MDRIILPTKNIIEPLRDNPEARYAAMHPIESGISLHGVYQCDQYRNGSLISGGYPEPPNTFITEGMNYLLDVIFGDTSKTGAAIWYLGIFQKNVTPAQANVASTALGAAGTYGAVQATSDVDETAFEGYTIVSAASASCTNAASQASYTMADTMTIYGAFLTNDSDMTSVSGKLISAKKFSASRDVIADDVLNITYIVTLTTS
jgi:hypothetical protein